MIKEHYTIRPAVLSDHAALKHLYQQVAQVPGGIARQYDEIDDAYIDRILSNSLASGIMLVVQDDANIIAAMHAYKLQPRVFAHMLGELTIAVHPAYQGQGIGRKLFNTFLETVKKEWPSIVRVELMVRESNTKAILFYESLDFKKEGHLQKRIMGVFGVLEADICMGRINPHYKV